MTRRAGFGVSLAMAVATLLAAAASPAGADMRANTATPTFTAAEQEIIDRNASLKNVLATDPWVVREFLDALAAAEPEASSPPAKAGEPDPDIKRYERASPEAAHDLLQIIKQAGSDPTTARDNTPPPR